MMRHKKQLGPVLVARHRLKSGPFPTPRAEKNQWDAAEKSLDVAGWAVNPLALTGIKAPVASRALAICSARTEPTGSIMARHGAAL